MKNDISNFCSVKSYPKNNFANTSLFKHEKLEGGFVFNQCKKKSPLKKMTEIIPQFVKTPHQL